MTNGNAQKSPELHSEGILKVEKTGYRRLQHWDTITADHKVFNEENKFRTRRSLQRFLLPESKLGVIYTDSSLEFAAAADVQQHFTPISSPTYVSTCAVLHASHSHAHKRAGALTFPPSCLDGGVTRVGPGQNPQYTLAPFGKEALRSIATDAVLGMIKFGRERGVARPKRVSRGLP